MNQKKENSISYVEYNAIVTLQMRMYNTVDLCGCGSGGRIGCVGVSVLQEGQTEISRHAYSGLLRHNDMNVIKNLDTEDF